MQALETEYTTINPTPSKPTRRIKTTGAIFLILSACLFVGLTSDFQNSQLGRAIFPQAASATTERMNGFFSSDVNPEICIKLERTNDQFNAKLFQMAPNFLRSMSGHVNADGTGQISITYPSTASDDNCALEAESSAFTYTCGKNTYLYNRVNGCPGSGGSMMSFFDKRLEVDWDAVNRIQVSEEMTKRLEGDWKFFTNGGAFSKVRIGSANVKKIKGKRNTFRITWKGMLSKMFQDSQSKFTGKGEGILFAKMYGSAVDFRWKLVGKNRMITENPDFSPMSLVGIREEDESDES